MPRDQLYCTLQKATDTSAKSTTQLLQTTEILREINTEIRRLNTNATVAENNFIMQCIGEAKSIEREDFA